MRKAIAILVCLMLLLAVGVAYNQCAQKQCDKTSCPSPCPGNCPTPTASCASCPNAAAGCAQKCACADCDGIDCKCADCKCANCDGAAAGCKDCACKGCGKVAAFAGTIRYVRSANAGVKVVAGDKGLLLRVSDQSASADALKQKLSALKRGDAVTAKFRTCPKSGNYYLVDIAAGAPAAAGGCCGGTGCPPTGGCAGQ